MIHYSGFEELHRFSAIPVQYIHYLDNEVGLKQCSVRFAMDHGGYITKLFLNSLSAEWHDARIDSYLQHCKKDQEPLHRGWHIDDIPADHNGKPEINNPRYRAEHIGLIIGDASLTEFAVGKVDLPKVIDENETVWNYCARVVDANPVFVFRKVNPGIQFTFGYGDIHRSSPATHDGWRYFIRVSKNSERPFINKVREDHYVK